jgi:4'-phosphopantetheinyl transferase
MTPESAPRVLVAVALIGEPGEERLAPCLDDVERCRAEAFRDPAARRRFVVAHGLLRWVLAARLGVAPADVPVRADRSCRPAAPRRSSTGVRWSLSHAGAAAVVAVADGTTVGVDVEPVDPRRADAATLARFLPPAELAPINVLDEVARPRELALAWTRLEAEAKGRRVGLDGLRGRPRTGTFTELAVDDAHVASLWTPTPVAVVSLGWT